MLTAYENTFYFAFQQFSVMDTDSIAALALETCATIPPQVDAIFQIGKLTHSFAYYLLQNSNFLNCI